MFAVRRMVFSIAAFLLLSGCGTSVGAWLRTQSGAISSVTQQAKDAVELGKRTVEQAKKQAADVASRAAQVQAGLEKIKEGEALVHQGLTGSGTSSKKDLSSSSQSVQ